jgi:hypothetical protein
MAKPYPLYKIYSNAFTNLVDGESAVSRIEITGSLSIDFNKYERKLGLMKCLDFNSSTDPMVANVPDITNISLPTAEEYAAWDLANPDD